MKHSLFFIGILFLYYTLSSQNLVPNGDFEYHTQPPSTGSNIKLAYPWFSPRGGSPSEYFNSDATDPYTSVPYNCSNSASYQKAHSGNGYAFCGIYGYNGQVVFREYNESRLTTALKPNTCYHCSFWISLVDVCSYRSNNIQAYFSVDSVNYFNIPCCINLPLTPQVIYSGTQWVDSVSWFHFDETFIANGGERFITIGNFLDDAHTNLQLYNSSGTDPFVIFYIDDVSVYPCDAPIFTANAGADTEICPGDNISLGMTHYDYYKYKWYAADGTLIDTTSSITVSPSSETTYILWIKDFLNQESYDTVTVRIKDCSPEPSAEIPNIFTPNSDGHNDLFYVTGNKIEKLNLLIYNRWGSKVFEGNTPQATWDGKLNGKNCAEGVYYYVADVTFTDGRTESRKGSVTLMR
jgi:gliding motility-associated-like protein